MFRGEDDKADAVHRACSRRAVLISGDRSYCKRVFATNTDCLNNYMCENLDECKQSHLNRFVTVTQKQPDLSHNKWIDKSLGGCR